jgi:hypothetical protein
MIRIRRPEPGGVRCLERLTKGWVGPIYLVEMGIRSLIKTWNKECMRKTVKKVNIYYFWAVMTI